MINNGKFVISLDFELLWGVRDAVTIEQYGDNIKGVHQVIPKLLDMFTEYKIKATFSTVGFLFFENKAELLHNLPSKIPTYHNPKFSPYLGHFDLVSNSLEGDVYHFAPQLIRLIQQHPEQEIGTHTFSHYYCLEPGQTIEAFEFDIKKAIEVAKKYNIKLTSLVFPRNQFKEAYMSVCQDNGIICYRGTEHFWVYKPMPTDSENLIQRAIRKIDAYVNISGHNCYSDSLMKTNKIINIPSSRLLRPISNKFNALEKLKLRRILSSMTHAARNNLTYHLWWHPHNFGINQAENFNFLDKILKHYTQLNKLYNFKSYSMSQLAKALIDEK